MLDSLIKLALIANLLYLSWALLSNRPMFPHRCHRCGDFDRNWTYSNQLLDKSNRWVHQCECN